MSAPSLYRRYRPATFAQVRGQDHVVGPIRNAVRTGTDSHAYLFSGPRGTGKTSTARILAKALNCLDLNDGEPCGQCDSCIAIDAGSSMDLFELDAASNNKVDDMRSLIGGTVVASPGRTKVYILDEVHMLSTGASNALLKTLEEPPSGVCFVLATTDPNKVLPTIRSRTQHFEFRLLSADELEAYVRWIADDAALDLSDEAVAHVVRVGRGSARDTLSALDQVVAAGGVVTRDEPVEALLDALAATDTGAAVAAVADALANGHDPRVLAEHTLAALRHAFLASVGAEMPTLLQRDRDLAERWSAELGTRRLTRALERIGSAIVDMRHAADARVPLEVALVSLTAEEDRIGELEARVAAIESGRPASAAGRRAGGPGPAATPAAVDAGSGTAGDSRVAGASAEAVDADAASTTDPAAETGAVSESDSAGRSGASGAAQARAALSASSGRRNAARPAPPGGASGGSARPAPARPAPARPAPARPAPVASGPEQAPTVPDPAPGGPTPDPVPSGSGPGSALDAGAVTMAFTDQVLPALKGKAKALLSRVQVTAVQGSTVSLAVENEVTMGRIEEFVPSLRDALASAVGAPVELALVIAGSAVAPAAPPAPAPAAAPVAASSAPPPAADPRATDPRAADPPAADPPAADPPEASSPSEASSEDDELIDLDELEDASDVATTGVARLTQAFPGAVVVDDEAGGGSGS